MSSGYVCFFHFSIDVSFLQGYIKKSVEARPRTRMNLFIPEQFPRNGFAHAAVGRHYRLASLRDFAQIKWRLRHGRSAFSLMPFRAFAILERRQSSESVQPSLGRGWRGDRDVRGVRSDAMRCLDASYLRPTQRSLSRVIGRPLYRVTLRRLFLFLHPDTVLDVLRRIFHRIAGSQDFLSPSFAR